MGTDQDWEAWGKNDPYFGVLSDADYRAGALSPERKSAFFRSGEQHVAALLETIRGTFCSDFSPLRTLDFGCGVGRLLIPLARRSGHATGIDISPSMLREAADNCIEQDVSNVDLIGSDDGLSQAVGSYDLVHSHIVLAHIDQRRGQSILRALADKVSPGGFIAVQVLYSCNASWWTRALVRLRYKVPMVNGLRNILRGRPRGEPAMQLHLYDLHSVLQMLRKRGFSDVLMMLDAFDNEHFESVVLLGRRMP